MNNELENIDELIGKFLAGEASGSEKSIVQNWIGEQAENQKHFDHCRTIFEEAASSRQLKDYDTDAAWNRVRENLRKEKPAVISIKPERYDSKLWLKIAASVVILISVGIYLFNMDEDPNISVEVIAEKHAVKDTLPDGSDVFLNKKTVVKYAYDKKTKTHDVKLKGEAYFDIKTGQREQFIIDAGNVFIKDIGTSFNVKAYPGTDIVEVLVEEGEIVFYTSENPGIHLKEGGKAVYNRKTKQFTIDQPEANITSYKTKFFVFSSADLRSVVSTLNNVYDTAIVIPDHLKQCPITVSFHNESIEDIATILAETLSLTQTRENGKIVLTGKGCD